jgi:hypothetical protein
MKTLLWAGAVLAGIAALAVGQANAQNRDIVFKPIDTERLVVQPSRSVAGLTAKTIDIVGKTAAGSIENNGWVKTINNLFSRKVIVPTTQSGLSALPSPNLFPSTQYKSFNTPVMPILQDRRR